MHTGAGVLAGALPSTPRARAAGWGRRVIGPCLRRGWPSVARRRGPRVRFLHRPDTAHAPVVLGILLDAKSLRTFLFIFLNQKIFVRYKMKRSLCSFSSPIHPNERSRRCQKVAKPTLRPGRSLASSLPGRPGGLRGGRHGRERSPGGNDPAAWGG